eukprot:c11286_g1_i1.p1 GENE.c11286_g1_i1~~c11286_g1_i1.p1  ORF type:complete len:628 (+),score=141.00 c11286_g1_i1:164-2047(+)
MSSNQERIAALQRKMTDFMKQLEQRMIAADERLRKLQQILLLPPTAPNLKLNIGSVTTYWYTERDFPPFTLQLVDKVTGQSVALSEASNVDVHVFDSEGHLLGSNILTCTTRLPKIQSTCDVLGLRFRKVSTKNKGPYTLECRVTSTQANIDPVRSEPITIVCHRILSNHTAREKASADDSVGCLPGVGPKYQARFEILGLKTIRKIAELPDENDMSSQAIQTRDQILRDMKQPKGSFTLDFLNSLIRAAKEITNNPSPQTQKSPQPTSHDQTQSHVSQPQDLSKQQHQQLPSQYPQPFQYSQQPQYPHPSPFPQPLEQPNYHLPLSESLNTPTIVPLTSTDSICDYSDGSRNHVLEFWGDMASTPAKDSVSSLIHTQVPSTLPEASDDSFFFSKPSESSSLTELQVSDFTSFDPEFSNYDKLAALKKDDELSDTSSTCSFMDMFDERMLQNESTTNSWDIFGPAETRVVTRAFATATTPTPSSSSIFVSQPHPMHLAVASYSMKFCHLVFDHAFQTNNTHILGSTNPSGQTPLMLACTLGNREAVALLLSAPCVNLNDAGTSMTTPLDIATALGDAWAVQLLREKGALSSQELRQHVANANANANANSTSSAVGNQWHSGEMPMQI